MGIRVNYNSATLTILRNLDQTSKSLDKSMARLSSGDRITDAGDDPAGLAASQSIRGEIRGIRQNVRNVNDGVSVASTIESSLADITNDLQRIRELALSSGSVAMTDEERRYNNAEVAQLLDEISRIASTTQFNGRSLLDGSYANARIQTGVASGQYISLTIPDMRTNTLGAIAKVTGTQAVSTTAIAGTGDLLINNVSVPASVADGVSSVNASASAIAKAKAINSISGQTGVTATAEKNVLTGVAPVGAVTLNGVTTSLTINGVNLGTVVVSANDATGNLVASINAATQRTGVTASLGPGNELILTAADGRNIDIQGTGGAAAALGLTGGAAGVTQMGKVTLSSNKTIAAGGTLGLIGFTGGQSSTAPDDAWAMSNVSVATADSAQKTLESVDAALKSILETRTQVGALQNRLTDTVNGLSNMIENLTATDSHIRDTDFALEAAQMTRDQILQNAATAILAQANALPHSVLDMLLR
ncbi:MAG: flagellin [Candidatus Sumerlaeota bacterium]|nr:flagellin [Candidatus Sumerlaeota bacterium]